MFKEIDEKNRYFAETLVSTRPRTKTKEFESLAQELDSELMAEVMWAFWGRGALACLDQAPPYLNTHLRWWKFGQQKRTIRKLIQTPEGRAEVWQMFHDASAWL